MTRRGSEKPKGDENTNSTKDEYNIRGIKSKGKVRGKSSTPKGALEKTKKKKKVVHETLSQQPTMVLVLVFIFSDEGVFFYIAKIGL